MNALIFYTNPHARALWASRMECILYTMCKPTSHCVEKLNFMVFLRMTVTVIELRTPNPMDDYSKPSLPKA